MDTEACSSPPNFFFWGGGGGGGGELKFLDQNNWGDLSKTLNVRGVKFKRVPNVLGWPINIVDKGVHAPPILDQPLFSKILLFLEIQDDPPFHISPRKTQVLNNPCNQFVYHFCPQSILVLEECLQKW